MKLYFSNSSLGKILSFMVKNILPRSRCRSGKKPGAGAANKFAGSPALVKTDRYSAMPVSDMSLGMHRYPTPISSESWMSSDHQANVDRVNKH